MNSVRSLPSPTLRQAVRSCLGAISLSALLLGAQAHAATDSSLALAPSAVSSAKSYVTNNQGKPGVKFLGGTVRSGSHPVAASLVTIYAAGTSGYGNASLAGLGFTDGNGRIFAVYAATANQQLYAVVTGGVVGGSTYNTAIGLSAPLGTFASAPANVTIDEVTTVGSVYALEQFLDVTGQKPGTSSTNVTGLNNAVSLFANLASLSSGSAATSLVTGASGTPPTATINTLANILASCVSSGSASSTQCSSLFAAATPAGGSAPTSTLAAAHNIALNAGSNVAALYALGAGGPYAPALSAAPNDWTIGISYTGGALDASSNVAGLAIDASGGAWVSSVTSSSAVNGGNGFVLRLSPQGVQGAVALDNGNIWNPAGVAIDASGHVWVANTSSGDDVNNGFGSVSGLASSGASLGGSPFTGGKVLVPSSLSTDPSGNVWVRNSGVSFVTVLQAASSYAGTSFTLSNSGGNTPNISALAVDGSGRVSLADGSNNRLYVLSGVSGAQVAGSPFSGGGLNAPFGLATDTAGNVWAGNNRFAGVTKFSAGTYSAVQYLSNDVFIPSQLAGDGAGNMWVGNRTATSEFGVVPLSGSGAPLGGDAGIYLAGGAVRTSPTAVAIDASGNLWLGGGSGHNVVELVGAAKPVKTPLVGQPALP